MIVEEVSYIGGADKDIGIGNKTILASAGIDALVDLPGVGENLQDHVSVLSDFQIQDSFSTFGRSLFMAPILTGT